MNYTQAQIDRANAVSLEDFLRTQGETLIKSGREYRWKEHDKALLDIWPVLPKETQILLKGKYILGYTDQELACQLKCKPSSIRMKLTRARRAALLLLSERNEVKEHDKT